MERKEVSNDSLPLESSLTDLILTSTSEKIRRPPNAFMLFARDHRRRISTQHPDVSNKTVSRYLGNIWKSTANDIKEKYYEKSRLLGELHKRRYPNYIYSPREARIQKMNKKRKKDEINCTDCTDSVTENANLTAVMKQTKHEDNSNQEEWITHTNHDPKSSPGYVPNNPEYFIPRSPEIKPEEDSTLNLRPQSDYSSESQYRQETGDFRSEKNQEWIPGAENCRWQTTPERYGCCNRNRLGSKERCVPPYEKRASEGIMPHLPDHLPCPYATPSPFCNPPAHFTGPMSSYCCGSRPCTNPVPRSYAPPFHTYWNSPMMNSPYYPSRECLYEDLKPYPFSTSYPAPEFFGPPFGYFERPVSQLNRNLNSGYHPPLSEGLDRRLQNEFVADNSESYSCSNRSVEKDNIHRSPECNLRNEDEMTLRNRLILRSDMENNQHLMHQNPVNRPGTKQQEALSPLTWTQMGIEGMHSGRHQYQYGWNNHPPGNKMREMPSSEPISTEQYQCDSSCSVENGNRLDISGSCNNKSQTQSESISSSVTSPESNKLKLNTLNVEKDIITTSPKFHRVPSLPAFESTRHPCSSTAVRPHQEICNRPATKQDSGSISNSPGNNLSATFSNKYLSGMNRAYVNFNYVCQNENISGNVTEGKPEVPISISYCKAPSQITRECPSRFDSDGLEDAQIHRINHDNSTNASQSQFSTPVVKMEVNGADIFSVKEISEENSVIETGNDGNNSQKDLFRAATKIEKEAFTSATSN